MALGPTIVIARMAKRLAEDVTIYTDGDEALAEEYRRVLSKSQIKVDTRAVVSLEKEQLGANVTVHFGDQSKKTEGFLVSRDYQQ